MSQHDYSLANQSRTAFRGDLNNLAAAVLSRNSGSSAPTTTAPFMHWPDTAAGVLKRRNAADSGWALEGSLADSQNFTRSSNTMLSLGNHNAVVYATGTFTQTFDATDTLTDNWRVFYKNAGAGVITLDPSGAELIDGAATAALYPGESCLIASTGSALQTFGRQAASAYKVGTTTRDVSTAPGNQSITGVGFRPKTVLLLGALDSAAKASIGFSDGATYRAIHTANSPSWINAAGVIVVYTDGGNYAAATVGSLDDDGFTLTWTKTGSPTGTAGVSYIAMR